MVDSKELKINELLLEFSGVLSSDILSNIKSLNDASEWGIALEELCNMLFEFDVIIDLSQYKSIEKVGLEMNLDENGWIFLKPLIKQ